MSLADATRMQRTFTLEDQTRFARFSGDFNPIHVDPVAARRLLFGQPLVHGIHLLLWAVEGLFAEQFHDPASPLQIESLTAEWRRPVLVGDAVACVIVCTEGRRAQLEIRAEGEVYAVINLTWSLHGSSNGLPAVATDLPEHTACRERTLAELKTLRGSIPLHLDASTAAQLFPSLQRLLLPQQLAILLATTRLVGMEAPGLHSLYSALDLSAAHDHPTADLAFAVDGFDERFSMFLPLQVSGPGFTGKVSTTLRPPPTAQAPLSEFLNLLQPDEFSGQRVLVIGGSRGLGEVTVKALVAGGAEVRFTYHRGAGEAARLVQEITATGRQAAAVQYSVQTDAGHLVERLAGFVPTMLCYFATPPVTAAPGNQFRTAQFRAYCDCYVTGFQDAFAALQDQSAALRHVFYPSTQFIDEPPPQFGEYTAAKAAAETLCLYLARTHRQVRFSTPRLSKMATDLSASVLSNEAADPKPVVIQLLRQLQSGIAPSLHAESSATPAQANKPAAPSLAIAATFTAEPAAPTLQFWLEKIGWDSHVRFAPFNQIFQSLLDPSSALNHASGAGALLLRLQDWVETEPQTLSADEWQKRLAPTVAEFIEAVRTPRRSPLIVVLCPASPAIKRDRATAASFAKLEETLLEQLQDTPGIYAFGSAAVAKLYPVIDIDDERGDDLGRVPYQSTYFAALSSFVVRQAHAVRMRPCKVIALDCDNTMWRGVCGEGGVTIDPAFRAVQEMAVRQMEQGRLLCLCSKNIEQDVFDVFDQHPDMLLRKDQLVAWRINWQPKSQNLRELAAELNVGVDSFLFLDDNPIECAEVRAHCPEAVTIQLPPHPAGIPRFLEHLWPLDQLRFTGQDRQRTGFYQQRAKREAVRKQSAGLDDFLAKLQLEMSFSRVDALTLPRASQLTERTNQFNVSTIRRSESQIQQLLNDPAHTVEIVTVQDRFGDYGIVGEWIARREVSALIIDTFLLSCRVLGRGVEHRMLARAGRQALEWGLPSVEIPFLSTRKNQPALDFLNAIALEFRTATAEGFLYKIPAEKLAALLATALRPAAELPQEDVAPPAPLTGLPTVPYQEIASQWQDANSILTAAQERQKRARAGEGASSHFVAPRNPLEDQMAEVWKRILNLDRIGVHDDYFASGGTSLLAVRLVLEIEKTFGKSLPIATLLKAPTIASLCAVIGAFSTHSTTAAARPLNLDELGIVPLREEGSQRPLILFAGVGGHTLSYRTLVQRLDFDQPAYGMDFRSDVAANRVPRPLETIAGEFVGRLLQFQPEGPYYLAGWSFGGYLAFAAAHELKRLGKEVALLVMFDTYGPGFPHTVSRNERFAKHLQGFRTRRLHENARYLLDTSKVALAALQHRVLKLAGARQSDFFSYPTKEIEQIAQVCDQATSSYTPTRWPGVLTMIHALRRPQRIGISFADRANGWAPFADSIDIREVNADHLSLFNEPDVADVAAALSDLLKQRLSE